MVSNGAWNFFFFFFSDTFFFLGDDLMGFVIFLWFYRGISVLLGVFVVFVRPHLAFGLSIKRPSEAVLKQIQD